ncbi:hypothetical protein [Sphingomonas lacusdianchii]|uniref:hypothetical protein n=1 Tax=Sphingomonas lacusdianchii TaxID=2917992 RepID=UPI001F57BF79|nr:hypothetical protein [Sphingomonas sp. JXJ CY 53]
MTADESPEGIAAALRAQAYTVMDVSPVAAAHLVLAAATLAPECDDERDVADQFSFVMADFAMGLAKIHHRARMRNQQQAEGGKNGAQ